MNLWNDGRSGTAGCLAGNLVLAQLRDTSQEQFAERKGTTFHGRGSIWVGRICSTDTYLAGRERHWANLSLEQHREVTHEAALEGASVKYLFITALPGQHEIRYWVVPGETVERVAFSAPNLPKDFVYSLHIRENEQGGFFVEGENVSPYHHVLKLNAGSLSRLEQAFESDRASRQRRQEKRKTPTIDREPGQATAGVSTETRGRFEIPLKGGRAAILQVPLPAADVDLARIKGWIDLMNDVLTEPVSIEPGAEARRVVATEAVKRLQASSATESKSRLTASEIDREIRQARRERK